VSWPAGADAARIRFDTVRRRPLTIGGRVWERIGWARFALAADHPGEPLRAQLATGLRPSSIVRAGCRSSRCQCLTPAAG
jgi:hypothetical protein